MLKNRAYWWGLRSLAAVHGGSKLSSDGRVPNSVTSPDGCLTEDQKLIAPDGVSMALEELPLPAGFSSVDRCAVSCKLVLPAVSAGVQYSVVSTPLTYSKDGAADVSSIGTVRVGDQGPCSSIGKLMENIAKIRTKFDDYRARGPEVSFMCESSTPKFLSEAKLDDDEGSSGCKGVGLETLSPHSVEGLTTSTSGGGPQSCIKKPKRRKKNDPPPSEL